jgi:hypothetical protein
LPYAVGGKYHVLLADPQGTVRKVRATFRVRKRS